MFTARRFTRRVDAMAAAAEAWGRGDLTPTIQEDAPDELGHWGAISMRWRNGLATLMELRQQIAPWKSETAWRRAPRHGEQQLFAIAMQLGPRGLRARSDRGARFSARWRSWRTTRNGISAVIRNCARRRKRPIGRRCAVRRGVVSPARHRRNCACRHARSPRGRRTGAAHHAEALANVARHSGADKARACRDAAGLCRRSGITAGASTQRRLSGIGRQSMRSGRGAAGGSSTEHR